MVCTMTEPHLETERWKRLTRASLQELHQDSPFFTRCETRRDIPSFLPFDIVTGNELGRGKFGEVKTVTSFETIQQSGGSRRQLFSFKSCQVAPDDHSNESIVKIANESLDMSVRLLCKMHLRNNMCRYAIKMVQDDLDSETKTFSIVDLAKEAYFLQPTVGEPGTLSFGLVLDRLTCTVADEIVRWSKEYSECKGGRRIAVLNRLFVPKARKQQLAAFYSHRLVIALDLARALRFLHRRNIVFRDMKPENLGLNLRGHLILFDFGCAKEFKEKDRVEGGYKATAMIGTVRFLAPENMKGLPYDLSCDVYALSLILWFLFSFEKPFQATRFASMEELCHLVSVQHIRPRRLPILSDDLYELMEVCWADNKNDRPSIEHVCAVLQAELNQTIHPSLKRPLIDRTKHILDISVHSMSEHTESFMEEVVEMP